MDGMHPAEHAVHGGFGFLGLTVLVIAAAGYACGVARLRRRGDSWPASRSAAAGLGMLAVAVALVLPPAGFPVHVVGHLLLAMLGPLLLALSAPVTLALRTASPGGRRLLLALLHSPWSRAVTRPAVVLVLEVGGLYAYYLTPLFRAASDHPWLGAVLHLHMFLAGCLFSWYLVGRDPLPRRPSPRVALAVLAVAAAAHDVLAKLLYARGGPAGGGSPEELRTGAQLMYYGGTLVEVVLAVVLMTAWYRRTGRVLERERRRA